MDARQRAAIVHSDEDRIRRFAIRIGVTDVGLWADDLARGKKSE
jgi:hypothetical protein